MTYAMTSIVKILIRSMISDHIHVNHISMNEAHHMYVWLVASKFWYFFDFSTENDINNFPILKMNFNFRVHSITQIRRPILWYSGPGPVLFIVTGLEALNQPSLLTGLSFHFEFYEIWEDLYYSIQEMCDKRILDPSFFFFGFEFCLINFKNK